jgi:hypothetical protein
MVQMILATGLNEGAEEELQGLKVCYELPTKRQ